MGKAQEISSDLSLEDSLDYDVVKSKVLRAYELVPEAYRYLFEVSFSCEDIKTNIC